MQDRLVRAGPGRGPGRAQVRAVPDDKQDDGELLRVTRNFIVDLAQTASL